MKLSDFVYPDMNVARSVNLERDWGESATLSEYQVTAKSLEVLARFVAALRGEKISAWSLTGPYGMGKSAFANFLIALTGNPADTETKLARKKFREADNTLYRDFGSAFSHMVNGKGFLRVPVTAAYEPINRTLACGLLRLLEQSKHGGRRNRKSKKVIDTLHLLCKRELPPTQQVIEMFAEVRDWFGVPILLVVDEFGKNLEYMAHHPDEGDIYIMQMLAEANHIFLWVCLHQGFEEYASGLTAQQRQEWSKVQGRFEDIAFVESTSQMLQLMQRALMQREQSQLCKTVERWTERFTRKLRKLDLPILHELDATTISALYPMHPLAAVALPELCRRFAQNDRTLFSFLCSGEPYALPSFLNKEVINGTDSRLPTLGLDYLYDYFFSVSTSAFLDRAESQRWIEIQDIIGQAKSFPSIRQRVLKTVGVLNLISSSFGLPATRSILKLALEETLEESPAELEQEIDDLANRKVLIFREYAQEYRLWEGSDFDILGATREKKAFLVARPLDQVLQDVFPLTPFIASRHSYETGTVRRFECRWMALPDLVQTILPPPQGFDGLLIYCFGNEKRVRALPALCANGSPLIVVYAPHQNQIQELVLEAAAARAILLEAPELVHDGVARKEARFRAQAAEGQLHSYVGQIYSPDSQELKWHAKENQRRIRSYRDLSLLASQLCDEIFSKCPHIGNEMINYGQLSSAAARARRELAEAMVAHEREENLGMTGFGPEVAIYRSLFLLTGLHQQGEDGIWQFVAPKRTSGLYPLWQMLSRRIREADTEGITVDVLITELKKPPFGMKEGPIPLYICLLLVVKADEIALFQEGTYKPYFGEAEIALLIKRPELFTIKRFAPVGLKRDVFETYLNILNTAKLDEKEGVRNPTLLSVVGPLVKFMENLSSYARLTRSVSLEAQRVRFAVLNSTEPLRLLFEDLPQAVGIEPAKHGQGNKAKKWKIKLQKCLKESLLELMGAYDKLNERVQTLMMEVFNFKGNLADFARKLRGRVSKLLPACRDEELRAVMSSIVRECDDMGEWIRGMAGCIMKNPLDSWRDRDFDPFVAAMRDYVDRIEHLEEIVSAGFSTVSRRKYVRVVSMMGVEGRMQRRILHSKATDLKKAKDVLDKLGHLSDQEQQALYAVLGDELFAGEDSEM